MKKILTIIGARPQIIKAAALSRAIKNSFSTQIKEVIVHTGQHYDTNMSDVFFTELSIPKPDYNLNIGSGSHGVQTARMIEGIEKLLEIEQPSFIVLYGDTNSTLAGAIAASKLNIPIVHIEAGLRSFNRRMPEEINRVTCDHLSTLLFSPTASGYNNLIKEGFSKERAKKYTPDRPGIFHCGDIMYDNSLYFSTLVDSSSAVLKDNNLKKGDFILATVHRDHNTDDFKNLSSIFKAFIKLAEDNTVVLPLHPRTKKMLEKKEISDLYAKILDTENLVLLPPASFLEMIALEKYCKMVITDSGGVQKEAYFFNKPCIILRPETEWVEILETGKAILVGADYNSILSAHNKLNNMDEAVFPIIFGDGKAAEFICETMINN